jgi:hypothetical protein
MKFLSVLPVILLFILTSGATIEAQKAHDIFQEGHIPEIRLTIRQADWARVLDSMKIYGEGMIVGAAEIDGLKYPNVGIRYRGQTSYSYEGKKNPFLIKLDYIHPEQQHQGYSSLTLSTALRDPSYLREYLGFAIARDYMDAPKANFCRLFVNNEYHGLYINIEPVDKGFLQRRASDRWSSLFKCSPKEIKDLGPDHCRKGAFANLSFEEDANCYLFNYTLKEGEGWQDLIELTRILEQEPSRVEEVLDVDAALWMLAFNNVLANLSSYTGRYSSNFYLYQGTDGRFVPVVWDLNLAFGSFKNTGIGSDLSSREMEKLDPFLHKDNPAKPLIKGLLQQDLYQWIYVAHMRQIINDHFRDDQFLNRARQLQKSIQQSVADEKHGYYTLDEFNKSLDKTIGSKTKIPGLANFVEARSVFLRKHESLRFVTPEIVTVDLAKRAEFSQETVESFNFKVTTARQARQVRLYYRFSPEESYQSVWLDVKPHEGLQAGQDHFVGSVTPPQGVETVEYYLMLVSNAAVSFHPERYRSEPHKARLEDLN